MNFKRFIIIALIGFFAGIISGFFSAGGGMILVPAYIHLLKMGEREARATSVFCILPIVIVCSIFYFNNSFIEWKIAIKCAIGGILGAYVGVKVLKKIPDKVLKLLFILFLIYSSFKFIK